MTLGRDLILALDPCELARAAGLDLDSWQAHLLLSEAPRELLNCCRQSGKSTTTAVAALHHALFMPRALVLLLSPSQRQSGELFAKIVALHAALSLPKLDAESLTRAKLSNGSRIVSLPGSERTTRGYSRATLVIIDEASRVDDSLIAAVRPSLPPRAAG